jgi:acyl-CoA synthetase (AMP-forming)/AMP-acid ligase II
MLITSPYPSLVIPDATLPELVLERARTYGDRPALVDGPSGRALSYSDLDDQARRCAGGFVARGLRPGDVVGIYAPNVPEYAVAFLGVALAGGTSTTANALYTAEELAFQLRDAQARFLVTAPALLDRALAAAAETGIREVFVFGEAEGATPFAALLDSREEEPRFDTDPAEHVISLPYSSGTTGLPKGVMLTDRNLVANALQVIAARPLAEGDTMIAILPFFHSYGQTVVMAAGLRQGATIVTMPRFDLEQYLELSERHRATVAYVAPPVVLALANHPAVDGYDLSGLRWILSGAAPLDAELAEAAAARLGCEVIQGYGMTEASPVTNMVPSGEPSRPGSVGPLVAGTEARLVDMATGADVATGEAGELLVRGPQVMKGYLNNAEATASTIVDGWLHTGDVARADPEGWITIVDRIKELIKVKGFQVAPAELEAILLTHPAVADACVIGIPDERSGEAPKGFVVLREPFQLDAISSFLAERVGPHKRLREIEAVDAIPKSASGKILRRVLVERERAARGGR